MFSRGAFPAVILSLALVAFAADITPTVPDPGHIYNEGSTCQIGWTPDATGQWKTMNIQLMTGNNVQMVHLTTVATVDGTTSPGTFSFPCPAVTIHAPIYFYQFSHASNASDHLWTGRFAIADASGTTAPAPNLTQPDGEGIPWGNGALVDSSKAVPPPSYLPGGSSAAPASASGSSSPSLAVPSQSSVAVVPSDAASASSSGSPSAANSAGNALASSGSSNGALMLGAVSARAAQAGVALAVIAGAFTLMV